MNFNPAALILHGAAAGIMVLTYFNGVYEVDMTDRIAFSAGGIFPLVGHPPIFGLRTRKEDISSS
jgi:hypothetical protein